MHLYFGDILTYPISDNPVFAPAVVIPEGLVINRLVKQNSETSLQVNVNSGYFSINAVHSNCGMVYLSDAYSGLDMYYSMLTLALNIAKVAGYTQVMYSAVDSQEIVPYLLQVGFVKLENSEFQNQRTGSIIHMYVYNIIHEEPEFEERDDDEEEYYDEDEDEE